MVAKLGLGVSRIAPKNRGFYRGRGYNCGALPELNVSGRTTEALFDKGDGYADSWASVFPKKWRLTRIGFAVFVERFRL